MNFVDKLNCLHTTLFVEFLGRCRFVSWCRHRSYGGYHSERTQQEDDVVRQEWLESVGYKVIRFSNEAILVDIKSTIYTIINYLRTP